MRKQQMHRYQFDQPHQRKVDQQSDLPRLAVRRNWPGLRGYVGTEPPAQQRVLATLHFGNEYSRHALAKNHRERPVERTAGVGQRAKALVRTDNGSNTYPGHDYSHALSQQQNRSL